jgi:hypothetical protein
MRCRVNFRFIDWFVYFVSFHLSFKSEKSNEYYYYRIKYCSDQFARFFPFYLWFISGATLKKKTSYMA